MTNNGIGAAPPYEIAGKPRVENQNDVFTAISLNQQTADERWAMFVKWTHDIDRRLREMSRDIGATYRQGHEDPRFKRMLELFTAIDNRLQKQNIADIVASPKRKPKPKRKLKRRVKK